MQARKVSPPTLAAEEAAAKEAMEAEVVVECEMEAVGVRRTAVDVLSSAGLAIIVSKAAAPAAHAALVGLSWVDPHRRPLPPKQTKDIVLVDAGLVHFVYCEKMPWYSLQAFHTTLSGGGIRIAYAVAALRAIGKEPNTMSHGLLMLASRLLRDGKQLRACQFVEPESGSESDGPARADGVEESSGAEADEDASGGEADEDEAEEAGAMLEELAARGLV